MQSKKKYKKQSLPPIRKEHITLGLGLFLFFAGFFLLFTYFFTTKTYPHYSPETVKSEMKKIPPEIKQQLTNAPVAASFRVPILLYHYVEYVQDRKDTIRQSLDINPYIFEQQVKTLRDNGYTFMTASQLADVLDGKMKLPPKPILLTFDDGHWDLFTDVLPILEKYNVKATAYIISGFLGGSDFLTKDQLVGVINSGLVEIGAHTIHHLSLKGLPPNLVTSEVNGSKNTLEQVYHIHVVSFAYPNGSFDQQAIDAVQRAGYTTAVSTIPGVDQSVQNRYFLYRIRPGGRIGDELLRYLQQSSFKAY